MVYQRWWYVVIVGTEPGIYSSWIEAGPKTKNIPGGAIFQKFATEAEAIHLFEAAKARGDVRAHPEAAEIDESVTGKPKNAPLSPLGEEASLLSMPSHLNGVIASTGLRSPPSSPARERVTKLRRTLKDSTCSTSSSPPTHATKYLPLYLDDTPPTTPMESSRNFTFTSSSSRAYPDISDEENDNEQMRCLLEVSDWECTSTNSSAHSRPGAKEHTSVSQGCVPLHPEPPSRSVGVAYQSLTDLADMQCVDPRIWFPISRVFDPDKVKPRPLTRPPSPVKGNASPASSYETARSNPPFKHQTPVNSPFVRAERGRYSRLTPSLSLPILAGHLEDVDERSNYGNPQSPLQESRSTGKAKAKESDCDGHDRHLIERPEGHCPSLRNDASRSHVQLVPREGRSEQSVIKVHCPPNCSHETSHSRSPPSLAPGQQSPRSTGPRYVDACVSPIITISCRPQESPTKIHSKEPDLDKDRPHVFAGFTHVSYKGLAPESDVRSPIVRGTMIPMSVAEVGKMRWQKTSRMQRLVCVTRLLAFSDIACFSVALVVTALTHAFWALQNTVWAAVSSGASV